MANDSWRHKLTRAEKHLQELDGLVSDYLDSHPYGAHGVRPSNRHPTKWRFTLAITKEPDPMIAVVLGDLLFNVRSALDHIAVAIQPRKCHNNAGFPIYQTDPLANDADVTEREKFLSLTKGMSDKALAITKWEQPYSRELRGVAGEGIDALLGLSALQNGDKHRRASVITMGLEDPQVTIQWPPHETLSIVTPGYVQAGAQLLTHADVGNRLKYDEVNVDVRGTPKVGVVVSGENSYELTGEGSVGRQVIMRARRIIASLEPFVI